MGTQQTFRGRGSGQQRRGKATILEQQLLAPRGQRPDTNVVHIHKVTIPAEYSMFTPENEQKVQRMVKELVVYGMQPHIPQEVFHQKREQLMDELYENDAKEVHDTEVREVLHNTLRETLGVKDTLHENGQYAVAFSYSGWANRRQGTPEFTIGV